jgi:isocitrate dehydrogenase
MAQSNIIYTITDEAPALATRSLLPIIRAFLAAGDIVVQSRDISLASRILAKFPEYLTAKQRVHDALAELGELVNRPEANIIKLPNISASIPQLNDAIRELQDKGFRVPSYPEKPTTTQEAEIKSRYDKIKGSAVNPIIREGNSDRRAPLAVKQYARKHPHAMGEWSPHSRTHVAHMTSGDFRGSEQSVAIPNGTHVRIEHHDANNNITVLKSEIALLPGEVIDAAVMSRRLLRPFLERQIDDAKENNLLFSLHLKATMMKVSDPIIFGHAVERFLQPVFEKHSALLAECEVNPNNGLAALYESIAKLPPAQRSAVEADIDTALRNRPALAMVDASQGITNLHVPSDVIIDASMPAMIRNSGQMWNAQGKPQDAKAVIPDSSYAGIYQRVIDFCRMNGAFNPATMGSVANIGLMAQQSEEYGSHDKTFEIAGDGVVRVVDETGRVLLEHSVETGDIWRMCQTKDEPVRDWVRLAVRRARATGLPAIFWLDMDRPHDAQLIVKVKRYLAESETAGLAIDILPPEDAMQQTLRRTADGEDSISVTGNVLRDYLTDLFPILELGTSAKMLSIVPLMNGGGLFETGAGGSAPKHVQQFVEEGFLRWDSLGEFLALSASLEHLSETNQNHRARLFAETLDRATAELLENQKSPGRKVGQLDNRGSHFYLALYWAEALSEQSADQVLGEQFSELAHALRNEQCEIIEQLAAAQGAPVDIGGYYLPDSTLADATMRPSQRFNSLLSSFVRHGTPA